MKGKGVARIAGIRVWLEAEESGLVSSSRLVPSPAVYALSLKNSSMLHLLINCRNSSPLESLLVGVMRNV